jgi:hypothetical protein
MPKEVTITIAIPTDSSMAGGGVAVGGMADTPPEPLSLEALGSPGAAPSAAAASVDTPEPLSLDQLRRASLEPRASASDDSGPAPLPLDELQQIDSGDRSGASSESLPEAQTVDRPTPADAAGGMDVRADAQRPESAGAATGTRERPALPADPPRRLTEQAGQ